ncbi:hypothetical protein C7212DRAFT_276141 [Tuber magnatum]|uniref:DNA/RNA-binding domain-containing protein n=1 Tax=Tuber magnatum TaxID=42249 RepID=A0A317T2D0_9PEZI|nr:hypothetical protein C7212DRAFT_276141 [Tuber magnatum]
MLSPSTSTLERCACFLSSSLRLRSLPHSPVSRLREAYVNILFVDFRLALDRDVEGRIWSKHHKIIDRYRVVLSQFQEIHGRKRPVELRKLQNSFINFIKQATRFYRSLIQRLISHFGLAELEWVIRKFNLSLDFPTTKPPIYEAEIKQLAISSCHRTLVFLGDLSRYREVSQNPKNWGPATGYYTLAKKLVPAFGSPHNQLAVIALNEGSNLSYTYHLYRALSVSEPFPEAGDNLGVGFRKVLKTFKVGNLTASFSRKEEQAIHELVALFVRLHAKCFTNTEFSDYEGLESEMLTQLALDLKERTMSNGMLTKFVLINIAAQSYATNISPKVNFSHSHPYFLRLNVATFTTLHQVFQPELERLFDDKPKNEIEPISAVGRRMLPALRLYSTWLRINHPTLTGQLADTSLSVLIRQLWQTYANTLSLLGATFPIDHLPKFSYLLEEDDDTIGFLPFSQANGSTTCNWGDESKEKSHPNDEMLARIRSLLEDGRSLCLDESTPISISNTTILYKEDGIPSSTPSTGTSSFYRSPAHPSTSTSLYDRIGTTVPVSVGNEFSRSMGIHKPSESVLAQGGDSIVGSVAGSETTMNKMVDLLVGPRDAIRCEEEEILFEGKRKGRKKGKLYLGNRDPGARERSNLAGVLLEGSLHSGGPRIPGAGPYHDPST